MADSEGYRLFLAMHHHEYGVTVVPFYCQGHTNSLGVSGRRLAKKLGLDYEPEKDEYIDVEAWTTLTGSIPMIKPSKPKAKRKAK